MPEAGTDAGSAAVYVCYMSSFGLVPPCLESSLLTFGVSPPQKPGLGPGVGRVPVLGAHKGSVRRPRKERARPPCRVSVSGLFLARLEGKGAPSSGPRPATSLAAAPTAAGALKVGSWPTSPVPTPATRWPSCEPAPCPFLRRLFRAVRAGVPVGIQAAAPWASRSSTAAQSPSSRQAPSTSRGRGGTRVLAPVTLEGLASVPSS